MRSRLPEKPKPLFLVAIDARNSDHEAEEARQTGNSKLLNSYRHLRVCIARIDLERLLAVVPGIESLVCGRDEAVIYKSDKGGVHSMGVTAGEVRYQVGTFKIMYPPSSAKIMSGDHAASVGGS